MRSVYLLLNIIVSVKRSDIKKDISDLNRMVDQITVFLKENRDSADFRIFCRGENVDVHIFILGAMLVLSFVKPIQLNFKGLRSLTRSTQRRNQV